MTAGESYYALGTIAGLHSIGLFSDLTVSQEYITLVGVALSATQLLLVFRSLGVQK